ncbi:nesprin-3 isoform X1 [Gadus morhua]|uniref:nesprin-3 isoform X1 n=1 Tax=Gadus morhua TaxID=8049 RepID=UPI0011B48829|nr:nesprin-3 isoform X1 [Gadus morhua]XP_030212396.1 nesprin-3 isoform X1 [Gadus morhua]
MTQKEQHEFRESLEAALTWMRSAQERLRVNDNTQGPREALEARLRETEKIHSCEHEGRVLVDRALVAAENLLQTGDEDQRGNTNAKLRDLKAQWEETCTYIVHCHSRVEWVWLHWIEYLKANEGFEAGLARLGARLDAQVELQLDAREKQWQADHLQVELSNVCGQAPLLERLLDEAEALHGSTQDPSLDPAAREALRQAYSDVRDATRERLDLLQKMAEEHQMYQGCVDKFQSMLLAKAEEFAELRERDDSAQDRFQALQVLHSSVAREEVNLQHLEGVAEAVQGHTSPAGAHEVAREALGLRQDWLRLLQDLQEADEALRVGADAHGQYLGLRRRLGQDIDRLQLLLQGLGRELEEGRGGPGAATGDEEQLVGRWKKYTGVRNTLTSEEPQVEHLKAQLKDLFRFSEDSSHLSDDVLAVMKEHQSLKCRAARLSSESESSLRQVLQDPLHSYSRWSKGVSQVLEVSAEVTDFSHIAMLVQNIEHLLKQSVQLQERLDLLQGRADLLAPLFGPQRAEGLGAELSAAANSRELLHTQLLERKTQVQAVLSRTEQFGTAHEGIRCMLSELQQRLAVVDVLQPDVPSKEGQAQQLRVILKDLDDCEAHIMALENLVSSSATNRNQFDKLSAEWKSLYKAVQVRVGESKHSIEEHQGFHHLMLSLNEWLQTMRQKLESFRGPTGDWSVEQRKHEAQRALGEFPGMELQLHQTEARGNKVLKHTSEVGRAAIQRDLKALGEDWMALYDLSLNLNRLLNSSTEELNSDAWSDGGQEDEPQRATTALPAGGRCTLALSGAPRGEGSDHDAPGQSHGHWAGQSPRGGSPPGVGDAGVGLGAGFLNPGLGAQRLDAEGDLDGPYRQSTPVDDPEDEAGGGAAVGAGSCLGWAGGRAEGRSRDLVDGGRSPEKPPVTGASVASGAVGPAPSLTADWTPGVPVASGRGRGGGASSLLGAAGGGASEGRRSGGPAPAEALGQGGGAFKPFQRAAAPLQPPAPPQSGSSPPGSAGAAAAASYLWRADGSVTASGGRGLGPAEYESKRGEFEAWLLVQNQRLSGLLSTQGAALGPKETMIRRDELQALRDGVARGQELFQLLIQDSHRAGLGAGAQTGAGAGAGAWVTAQTGEGAGGMDGPELMEDSGLEDLRYRWMLYKSKLKELGDLGPRLTAKGVRATKEVPVKAKRILKQKGPGLLQRVWRVALPLWLLLLALLLLAFLLPFFEDVASCSLTNNFARSFNVMLRYEGPPPT